MKRKIIALLFLLMGCTFLNAAPYSEKIKELLVRLDSLIAQKNTFAMLKEAKIAQLHKLQKNVRTYDVLPGGFHVVIHHAGIDDANHRHVFVCVKFSYSDRF